MSSNKSAFSISFKKNSKRQLLLYPRHTLDDLDYAFFVRDEIALMLTSEHNTLSQMEVGAKLPDVHNVGSVSMD